VNLFSNAIEAMNDEQGKITVSARAVNGCISIQIADDGPGIPEGVGEQVFEPFFSNKPGGQGTGLGLFIVRQIIDEHLGEISVAPGNGNGARFNIVLPVPREPDSLTAAQGIQNAFAAVVT
jgi:two-component system sensor histidine kinase HupT/HoxJ